MRRLRLFLVSLIVFAVIGPLSMFAQASDAERRHPRPGQHRDYRHNDRGYRPQYRHYRSYGYGYRNYGHRSYYRPMCRYRTGYWDYDRYGAYFVPTGSYLAPCR